TNLNVTSWLGNCELDCVVEDEAFARQMEEQYERDLEQSTEVVLDARRRLSSTLRDVRSVGDHRRRRKRFEAGGSTYRAAAGAVRLGNAMGGVLTNRRSLGPVEARLTTATGWVLLAFAALVFLFPWALAYPVALMATWGGAALIWRGVQQLREARKRRAG